MTSDLKVYTTPPDFEGRTERETRTYKLLSQLNIPFERIEHSPAETISDCAGIDRTFGTPMCKNLLLCNSSKSSFYLLLMPGDKMFDTKELRSQIDSSRLSFAPGEYMVQLLDIYPGSLSVLGLQNDKEHKVRLLIDKAVSDNEYICCHPCVNTASLKIRTSDILNVFLKHTGHTPTIVNL